MQGLNVRIGVDTEIGAGLQIYGRTLIRQNCRIEGPTTITDSVLDEGVYIRSFSVLEGAHVSAGSGAGPFARLREGTDIGPHSYVGNFVETKNASLGSNTLACHLTYIGDAEASLLIQHLKNCRRTEDYNSQCQQIAMKVKWAFNIRSF